MTNRWDIYEVDGYENILKALDRRFGELIVAAKVQIQAGEDPIFAGRNVRRKMEQFMDSINGYGTSDTEPRIALVTFICNELNIYFKQETIDQLQ